MKSGTTILILNYNAGEALRRCLESLRGSDAADLPVLLVDNASTDGSVEPIPAEFPEVEVLALPANGGFARGVNRGLRHLEARGFERILLLNPDTRVRPVFLEPLQRALEEGADLAGPKLLGPGEPPWIWCAGGDLTFGLNLTRLRGHRQRDRGQFDRAQDVSFLPATVWLLDRHVFETVGTFDERFFCYVEDVDFCIRVTRAGLRIRYVPQAVVVHEGSTASGGGYTPLRKYLNAQGSWELLRKHGNLARWVRFLACDVLTAPLALLYGVARRRPAAAWWKLRGELDGMRGRACTEERLRRLLPGVEP